MFKPRTIPKSDNVGEDEIKKEISAFETALSLLIVSETSETAFNFDDVVQILEKENASLTNLLLYEETVRKVKLLEEKSTLSREKEEEENVIASCSNYLKNESFVKGEIIDNSQEMLLKLEVLNKKLSTLLKKFAHDNFSIAKERSIRSASNRITAGSDEQKKYVLHILRLLLPELSSTNREDSEPQMLKIDETMPNETIEFLLASDIIEKCPNNSNYIRLLD